MSIDRVNGVTMKQNSAYNKNPYRKPAGRYTEQVEKQKEKAKERRDRDTFEMRSKGSNKIAEQRFKKQLDERKRIEEAIKKRAEDKRILDRERERAAIEARQFFTMTEALRQQSLILNTLFWNLR